MGILMDVGTADGFCEGTKQIWGLVGTVLRIVTIVLIVAVIIFGIIDFGKAVVASKPEDIKNATKNAILRVIAVIVIFFIPTLVGVIFRSIGYFKNVEADFNICASCIESPSSCND